MKELNIAQINGLAKNVRGNGFYSTGFVESSRTSGAVDKVPFIYYGKDSVEGDLVSLSGKVVTKNIRDSKGVNHKNMYVKAESREDWDGEKNRNIVEFNCVLVRKDSIRKTPLGKTIMDIVVAINETGKSSQYPSLIVWGGTAEYVDSLPIGTDLHIQGRFQSREYQKLINGEEKTKTAYEISVSSLEEI